MSLGQCEKCWDNPCTCGYQYRNYSKDNIIDLIGGILHYRNDKDEIMNELMSKELKSENFLNATDIFKSVFGNSFSIDESIIDTDTDNLFKGDIKDYLKILDKQGIEYEYKENKYGYTLKIKNKNKQEMINIKF